MEEQQEKVVAQVQVSVNTKLLIFCLVLVQLFWTLVIYKFGVADGFQMSQKSFYIENFVGESSGLVPGFTPQKEVRKRGK